MPRSAAAVAWLALGLLGLATESFAATVTSQQTQLSVDLSLPAQAPEGAPYHGTMTASASGLVGCYRWIVSGLPRGLEVSPAVSCASGGPTITSSVTGVPAAPVGASFAATVTVTLEAVGTSPAAPAASGPVAGTATSSVVVLPGEWGSSTATDAYAGTRLSLVSCSRGPSCWVVGTSQNVVPPPTAPPGTSTTTVTSTPGAPGASGETGTRPVPVPFTIPGTSRTVGLVEGGTFVASVDQISPLRLGIVRAAIPLSVSGISCPSASACVLVGSEPAPGNATVPAVLLMTDAGATWSAATLALSSPYTTGSLTAVTCPRAAGCLATGTAATAASRSSGFTVPIALTGDGATETARFGAAVLVSSQSAQLADLSCANASDCVAVGRSAVRTGATDSAVVLATTDAGASWRVDQHVGADSPSPSPHAHRALQPWMPTVDGPLEYGGLVGVGCAPGAAARSCEVSWPFWPALANTVDGTHWYSDVPSMGISGSMGGSISCPSAGRCFGVSATQFMCAYDTVCTSSQILETIPAAANWEVGLAGEGPSYHFGPWLESISCPSVSTCVAVGSWSPRSGSSWSPVFPLVMSPQLAIHPFFLPPPPPGTLLTWTNAGILLGIVSLATGVGAFVDVFGAVALVTGVAGVGIGAATTAHGDALGWASVALGSFGLVCFPLSVASFVAGVADVPLAPSGASPGVPLPQSLDDVPTPESSGEVPPGPGTGRAGGPGG
ncbi:MAG: hypothetical protein M0Z33_10500 [Actinomycetota bacterium]|nr:hypothetical protein [Actinomycetota bacterium]